VPKPKQLAFDFDDYLKTIKGLFVIFETFSGNVLIEMVLVLVTSLRYSLRKSLTLKNCNRKKRH